MKFINDKHIERQDFQFVRYTQEEIEWLFRHWIEYHFRPNSEFGIETTEQSIQFSMKSSGKSRLETIEEGLYYVATSLDYVKVYFYSLDTCGEIDTPKIRLISQIRANQDKLAAQGDEAYPLLQATEFDNFLSTPIESLMLRHDFASSISEHGNLHNVSYDFNAGSFNTANHLGHLASRFEEHRGQQEETIRELTTEIESLKKQMDEMKAYCINNRNILHSSGLLY